MILFSIDSMKACEIMKANIKRINKQLTKIQRQLIDLHAPKCYCGNVLSLQRQRLNIAVCPRCEYLTNVCAKCNMVKSLYGDCKCNNYGQIVELE